MLVNPAMSVHLMSSLALSKGPEAAECSKLTQLYKSLTLEVAADFS